MSENALSCVESVRLLQMIFQKADPKAGFKEED